MQRYYKAVEQLGSQNAVDGHAHIARQVQDIIGKHQPAHARGHHARQLHVHTVGLVGLQAGVEATRADDSVLLSVA